MPSASGRGVKGNKGILGKKHTVKPSRARLEAAVIYGSAIWFFRVLTRDGLPLWRRRGVAKCHGVFCPIKKIWDMQKRQTP
ncbi:hypothetical protein NBRC116598_31900 [Pseudophaeobacter arcticus]|uniref:Uncharacterized protein n=1 Tax=Pseudophaeobacter arcticus TaxID=385492 RepID=A0ABQ0APF3_9RHOB